MVKPGEDSVAKHTPLRKEDCLSALQAVLTSPQFRRSSQLRRFLSYVVQQTLEGADVSLSEQQIGVSLFGRRPSYDTSSDNIVRVYASEIRKRLEIYYENEGKLADVRIEIPRGAYKPLFTRMAAEVDEPIVEPEPDTAPSPAEVPGDMVAAIPPQRDRRLLILAALLCFAVLGAIIQSVRVHWLQNRLQPWTAGSATSSFWQPFFQGPHETVVVLADTNFAMAQDLAGYRFTLTDYLNQAYLRELPHIPGVAADEKTIETLIPVISNRNSGSVSDFRTAQRILALAPGSSLLRLEFARDFSAETLRHGSTILLGSSRSNPWSGVMQDKLFYRLESFASRSTMQVRNIKPRPGEKDVYLTSSDPNRTDGYCIVALLPSPGGEGRTLLIAGTDSQATESGGEFLTREDSLRKLQQTLGTNLSQPFQLLLRTSRAAGSPLSTEIVLQRPGLLN